MDIVNLNLCVGLVKYPKNFRIDIYSCARILNLIVHYELRNYKLLDSLSKSYHAGIQKKKNPFKTEKIILEYIKKNPLLALKEDELLIKFKELHRKLEVVKETEKMLFNNFNFLTWLEGKINAFTR